MGYNLENLYRDLTGKDLEGIPEPVPLTIKEVGGIKLPVDAKVSYAPESEEVTVRCNNGYLTVSRGGYRGIDIKGGGPVEQNDPLTEKVGKMWKEFLEAYKIV